MSIEATQTNSEGKDATDNENQPPLADLDFKELATSLREAKDLGEKIACARTIRKALAIESPPIPAVMESDIPLTLISYLHEKEQIADVQHQELVHEALWALTNLVSGTDDTCRELVEFGVISAAVEQMKASPSNHVVDQTLWLIGNIAGTSSIYRDMCLEADALDEALKALGESPVRLSLQRLVAWVTSNLLRGKPPPRWDHASKAVPCVVALLQCSDDETKMDALWSLAYISDGDDEAQTFVASFDVCPLVASNLQSDNLQKLVPALRCLGNLLSGPDRVAQKVIDAGALNSFVRCIASPRTGVRRETLWAISNVTAGTSSQIQAVIDVAGLLPAIFNACTRDNQECAKEARWAIMNAIIGSTRAQTAHLAEIPETREVLATSLQDRDVELVLITLEATTKMLEDGNKIKAGQQLESNPFVIAFEESGIVDVLEMLQAHEHNAICAKALDMLERYFVDKDGDAPTITSEAAPASFVFN